MNRSPSIAQSATVLASAVFCLQAIWTEQAQAQGCVAVRGGGMCTMNHSGTGEDAAEHGPWLASVGYRFFKSDRHFIGGNESRNAAGLDRFQQGTEVINYSQFIDTSVTYQFSPRLSASLVLPWVHHIRSAPYEHSGVRRDTGATGIGDVRAVVGYWLWDPKTQPKGNLQVSLGGKAPSGDYQADDTFFQDQDPTAGVNIQPVRRNVDQSIQPGDGGWGVSWELNGYRELTKGFFAYAQAYYLFNPQNVNGVKSPTARSDAGPTIAGKNIDNGMSITDQYMFRAGFSKVVSEKHNLSVSLGGRMEGIPVEDLNGNAGNEEGFRRPGYAIAIEPGINWMPGKWNVAITVPWRLEAQRERSYWNLQKGTRGDAAFADYLVTVSVSRWF